MSGKEAAIEAVTPGGARDWTGTLYLLYHTLVCPSPITVSTYCIQKYKKNKITTVVVFTVSHAYSPESHLHIQKLYIYIYQSECRTSTSVLAQQNAEDHCLLLLYLHGLKTRAKLYA